MDPSSGDNQPLSHQHSHDRFAGAFGGSPTGSSGRRGSASSQGARRSPGPSHTPHSNSNPTSPVVAGLNPRSCVTCRRRKVKCDKRQPCSNCLKAHIDCVFPRPGRAPRKAKKPPDAELLSRLRNLEAVVQRLGKGASGEEIGAAVAADADASAAAQSRSPEEGRRTGGDGASPEGLRRSTVTSPEIPDEPPSLANPKHNPRLGDTSSSQFNGRLRIEKEMGNLVVGEGKSRYVSNTFWVSLTEEVAEMREMVGDPSNSESEEDESHMSPQSIDSGSTNSRQTHQEFVFGYSSTMITLRILHPPSKQISTYWDIYVENVDPVIRILHRPTARHLFALAARDHGELSRSGEALVFAVYFGVVTSLSPEDCQSRLGLDREIGLKRYRFATEQALARANFLATQELLLIQALCLFLTCVRRHDETKSVWTMTGMLMRMAQSIGLHRDGTNFNLPPFQCEMRRRLWWQVCTLDVRSSEDQGADPIVAYLFHDTRKPLNINDEDMWPDMKEFPKEHEGATEMTFDLVRYEIGGTIRLLSASQSSHKLPEVEAFASLEAKEQLLDKLRFRLEDEYLRHCDMSIPLQWVAANVARLVMSKIWLVIHHPFRHSMGSFRGSEETRNRTFLTSIDVIRYSRMLETQQKTAKWGWLFRSYFQWHAVAFLLSELCLRTSGTAVDDAWEVLAEAFPDWEIMKPGSNQGMRWKPLQKLIARAKAIRIAELRRRRAFPNDGSLGPNAHNAEASHDSLLAAARAHVAATDLIDLQDCRASAIQPGGSLALKGASASASPSSSNSQQQKWSGQPNAQQQNRQQQMWLGALDSSNTMSPSNSASGATPPTTLSSITPSGMDIDLSGIATPHSNNARNNGNNATALDDMAALGLESGMAMGGGVNMGTSTGLLRSGGGLDDAGIQGDPMPSNGNGGYGSLWFDDPFLQDNSTWDVAGADAPWADMMAGLDAMPATDGSGDGAQNMGQYGGVGTTARGAGNLDMNMDLTSGSFWNEGGGF